MHGQPLYNVLPLHHNRWWIHGLPIPLRLISQKGYATKKIRPKHIIHSNLAKTHSTKILLLSNRFWNVVHIAALILSCSQSLGLKTGFAYCRGPLTRTQGTVASAARYLEIVWIQDQKFRFIPLCQHKLRRMGHRWLWSWRVPIRLQAIIKKTTITNHQWDEQIDMFALKMLIMVCRMDLILFQDEKG